MKPVRLLKVVLGEGKEGRFGQDNVTPPVNTPYSVIVSTFLAQAL